MTDFQIPDPAWRRAPGESTMWYERFLIYRDMGPDRSVRGAFQLHESRTKGIPVDEIDLAANRHWYAHYENEKWEQRAIAWDDHVRAKREAEWERRREELLETEWELARRGLERVGQMLSFPLTRRDIDVDENGRIVTVIEPADWRVGDIARLLKEFDAVGRRSTGLETDRIALDGDVTLSGSVGVTFEQALNMTPEERRQLLADMQKDLDSGNELDQRLERGAPGRDGE